MTSLKQDGNEIKKAPKPENYNNLEVYQKDVKPIRGRKSNFTLYKNVVGSGDTKVYFASSKSKKHWYVAKVFNAKEYEALERLKEAKGTFNAVLQKKMDPLQYNSLADNQVRFLATYHPGKSFLHTLKNIKSVNEIDSKCKLFFDQVMSELKRLVKVGIVHLDPHADNILWDENTNTAKMIDFDKIVLSSSDRPMEEETLKNTFEEAICRLMEVLNRNLAEDQNREDPLYNETDKLYRWLKENIEPKLNYYAQQLVNEAKKSEYFKFIGKSEQIFEEKNHDIINNKQVQKPKPILKINDSLRAQLLYIKKIVYSNKRVKTLGLESKKKKFDKCMRILEHFNKLTPNQADCIYDEVKDVVDAMHAFLPSVQYKKLKEVKEFVKYLEYSSYKTEPQYIDNNKIINDVEKDLDDYFNIVSNARTKQAHHYDLWASKKEIKQLILALESICNDRQIKRRSKQKTSNFTLYKKLNDYYEELQKSINELNYQILEQEEPININIRHILKIIQTADEVISEFYIRIDNSMIKEIKKTPFYIGTSGSASHVTPLDLPEREIKVPKQKNTSLKSLSKLSKSKKPSKKPVSISKTTKPKHKKHNKNKTKASPKIASSNKKNKKISTIHPSKIGVFNKQLPIHENLVNLSKLIKYQKNSVDAKITLNNIIEGSKKGKQPKVKELKSVVEFAKTNKIVDKKINRYLKKLTQTSTNRPSYKGNKF